MGSENEKVQVLLSEGLSLYGEDRVEQAVSRWREALSLDPECADARDFLADAGFPLDDNEITEPGVELDTDRKNGVAAEPATEGSTTELGAERRLSPPPSLAEEHTAPTVEVAEDGHLTSPTIELDEVAETPFDPGTQSGASRHRSGSAAPGRRPSGPSGKKGRGRVTAKPEANAPPISREALESLLTDAVTAVAKQQSEQALEILEALSQRVPTNLDVQCYYELVRTELAESFRDRLGSGKTVYDVVSRAELFDLNLPTEAGYLASLIDGEANLDAILDLSAIDRFETVRTLAKLLNAGAIRVVETSEKSDGGKV